MMSRVVDPPFGLEEVRAAQLQLRHHLIETPIHTWRTRRLLDEAGEIDLVLKLELLQHTGTFKPRGALLVMNAMTTAERARGATTVSAGNHAIAVAFGAERLGISAKVAMPITAPAVRIESARAHGAEVLLEADLPSAFAKARALQEDEGRTLVHPFEGPLTALGTATLGLEFSAQAGTLDALVIAIGGGGLCAGVATVFRLLQPNCRIFGAEPAGADTMRQSIRTGTPVSHVQTRTIADSLAPPLAMPYSFELCRRALDDIVVIEDSEIIAAMRLLFDDVKIAVEPAGAAAVAAVLGPLKAQLRGMRVGAIVCGANISREHFFHLTR
jgi:threonine dehydratase